MDSSSIKSSSPKFFILVTGILLVVQILEAIFYSKALICFISPFQLCSNLSFSLSLSHSLSSIHLQLIWNLNEPNLRVGPLGDIILWLSHLPHTIFFVSKYLCYFWSSEHIIKSCSLLCQHIFLSSYYANSLDIFFISWHFA